MKNRIKLVIANIVLALPTMVTIGFRLYVIFFGR